MTIFKMKKKKKNKKQNKKIVMKSFYFTDKISKTFQHPIIDKKAFSSGKQK